MKKPRFVAVDVITDDNRVVWFIHDTHRQRYKRGHSYNAEKTRLRVERLNKKAGKKPTHTHDSQPATTTQTEPPTPYTRPP